MAAPDDLRAMLGNIELGFLLFVMSLQVARIVMVPRLLRSIPEMPLRTALLGFTPL